MRAWIEILKKEKETRTRSVALYMRAWIEIGALAIRSNQFCVALYMRAWIEIRILDIFYDVLACRPLHEGVD